MPFKNGEFDIEDKERSERLKVYEDAELQALLDQDSCQTQEELACTFEWLNKQFYNKCPIFDKKRRKLICKSNIICRFLTSGINYRNNCTE